MRLDKFLSDCGKGTRSELKNYIKKGAVTVGSAVIKDASFQVAKTDEVFFKGEKVNYEHFVYLMLNKPQGVVSATSDKHYKTVIDLLGDEYKHFNLFPVGRLDIDTEGLLILTNDGNLAHKSLSPKHHVEKTYYIESENPITEKDKEAFSEGVIIDGGYKTLSSKLEIISEYESTLTITEGKYHQVKLMFESRNNKVTFLKRIKFGNITLDNTLKPGEYRPLKPHENAF
ncbi:MAG: pseudouridine synthase [Bacillota bacterium]|nr:pseudouridine synthase [Bacillota bacterium]